MWNETIAADNAYDYHYLLKRIQMDRMSWVDAEHNAIKLPIVLNGSSHVASILFTGDIAAPKAEISSASNNAKNMILTYVTEWLQWDKDLSGIGASFIGSSLEQLFYAHAGTPIVKDNDLYYSLMKTIIHQQLNLKFAYTLTARFVERYGRQEQGVWFYPDPEKVAELSYEDLRSLQFSQRKAEYVIDTSRIIAEGALDLDQLKQLSDEEIKQELVKVRGIGPWSAESWMLFGLGRENLMPAADIGIQNALKFYWELDKKPSASEIYEWSRDWEPYRSYAAVTLWRSIET